MSDDSHQITLTFTLAGGYPSIDGRLRVLAGNIGALGGHNVRATIDGTPPTTKERLDSVINILNAIRDDYTRALAYKMALCETPETATAKQCNVCPNRVQMPDGGTMCDLTRHAIKGAL